MVPRKLVGLALVLAAFLLTGCAGEFVTDLYVQDIWDVINGEEEYILTTGSILIESPGEEYNELLKNVLEQNFRDVKNFRTGSGDYSSKVIVDVKVPVLDFDESLEEPWIEESMAIVVMPMDDGWAAFGLALNGEKIDGMFAAIQEETFMTVGVKDFSFFVNLNNDMRGTQPVYLQGVYADGRPFAYEEVIEMERRDMVELQLGDVARDYACEEGWVFIGVLEPLE